MQKRECVVNMGHNVQTTERVLHVHHCIIAYGHLTRWMCSSAAEVT